MELKLKKGVDNVEARFRDIPTTLNRKLTIHAVNRGVSRRQIFLEFLSDLKK